MTNVVDRATLALTFLQVLHGSISVLSQGVCTNSGIATPSKYRPMDSKRSLANIGKMILLSLGLAVSATVSTTATAAVIDLSFTTTAAGTSGPGTNSPLDVPGTYVFGNVLPALGTPVFTHPVSGASYEFYDDYVFTIAAATTNVLTSSLDLSNFIGLDDFQVRLYELAGNEPLPALGAPAGGTLLQAWSMPISAGSPPFSVTGMWAMLGPQTLDAGSYVLEVRGNVSGLVGGAYAGIVNLAPVPLPGALWLLLSGIGGLSVMRRMRRAE